MVFINPERAFAELRGTVSHIPFHGVVPASDPVGFWWFKSRSPQSIPKIAYVCEGAIDAISLCLYLIADNANHAEEGLYCSIDGVANQQRIYRIKAGMSATGCQTVLPVDNDQDEEDCRWRNPGCKALPPWANKKGWNEVLCTKVF